MFIRKSTDFPATTQHVTFLTFDVMQHTLTNRNQTGGVGLGSLLTIKIGDSKMNNGKFYLTFLSIRDQNTIFTLVEKKSWSSLHDFTASATQGDPLVQSRNVCHVSIF